MQMPAITAYLDRAEVFMAVGTSGVVYPAAGFANHARHLGARCVEINPEPTGGAFSEAVAAGAEEALPALVAKWCGQ